MKIELVLFLVSDLYPTDETGTEGFKCALYAPVEKLLWPTDAGIIDLSKYDLRCQSTGFFIQYGHKGINLVDPGLESHKVVADGFNNSSTKHILRTFEIEEGEFKISGVNNK